MFATSNGDQILQSITNIGRLCDEYPPFMSELNSFMPTGYRIEIIDASTIRLFEPDKEPSILRVGISERFVRGYKAQVDPDAGLNEQREITPKDDSDPEAKPNTEMEALLKERPYQCALRCNAAPIGYTSQKDLQRHIRIYHPELINGPAEPLRPITVTSERQIYPCSICGKTFTREDSQVRHERIHHGARPFKCPHMGCEKDFARRDDLQRHEMLCSEYHQKGNDMPAAPNRPKLGNRNNSEAAIMQQEESCNQQSLQSIDEI